MFDVVLVVGADARRSGGEERAGGATGYPDDVVGGVVAACWVPSGVIPVGGTVGAVGEGVVESPDVEVPGTAVFDGNVCLNAQALGSGKDRIPIRPGQLETPAAEGAPAFGSRCPLRFT